MNFRWTQGLVDKLTLETSVDWTYYGTNNEAGTDGRTLTQGSTFVVFAWLNYDIRRWWPTASNAFVSLGMLGRSGGAEN